MPVARRARRRRAPARAAAGSRMPTTVNQRSPSQTCRPGYSRSMPRRSRRRGAQHDRRQAVGGRRRASGPARTRRATASSSERSAATHRDAAGVRRSARGRCGGPIGVEASTAETDCTGPTRRSIARRLLGQDAPRRRRSTRPARRVSRLVPRSSSCASRSARDDAEMPDDGHQRGDADGDARAPTAPPAAAASAGRWRRPERVRAAGARRRRATASSAAVARRLRAGASCRHPGRRPARRDDRARRSSATRRGSAPPARGRA